MCVYMCFTFQPHPNKICLCPGMSWEDNDRWGEAGTPTRCMSHLGSLKLKEIRPK